MKITLRRRHRDEAPAESEGLSGEVGMSSNMARLAELQSSANEILAEAIGHVDDAFNAGDLRCIDAQWVVSVHGDSYYRVVISEASPDAVQLQQHVFERLAEKGLPEVEVTTEW